MSHLVSPAPPVQIPGAPSMEHVLSQSPRSVPTPPDEQIAPQTKTAQSIQLQSAGLPHISPNPATLPTPKVTAVPSAREYASSLLRYGSLRTAGFRTSAERQGTATDTDVDMNVDDVFSVAAADRRTLAREIDDMRTSPHYSDSDDSLVPIPRYSNSLSSSPGADTVLSGSPDTRSPLSSSLGSRRSAVRPLSQARSYGGDPLSISAGSRRAPYAVPSRSPASLGPLSMAMSGNTPLRIGRRPSWAARAPSMTPLQPPRPVFDEDETDTEVDREDDEATEDEDTPSRPHSPSHDLDASDMDLGNEEKGDGIKKAIIRPGLGANYAVPRYRFYSSSLPESRWGAMAAYSRKRAPADDTSQVHLAAAALDRLSMAPVRDIVEEQDDSALLRDRMGVAGNCSAFISKLWHLLSHPELYGRYIHWSENGDVIIMRSDPHVAAAFASNVLPKLFKHGNNASFVRQLNLYGFQRVPSSRMLNPAEMQAIASRGTTSARDRSAGMGTASELYGMHSAFAHPRFRRGQEAWLASMRPRSSKKPKKPVDAPS